MSGDWEKIECPFHPDNHPSAAYTTDGGFVCHACGTRGDLYRLLKEELELDDAGAAQRYQEITQTVYEPVRSRPSGIPGRNLPTTKRDYERGTELFPSWFRGESRT